MDQIAFLLRLWPVFGGGETVTLSLANELVKRGHAVTIIYFKDNRRGELPFIDKRIQTRLIADSGCDELKADPKKASYIKEQLVRIIREQGIEIVINQWWPVEYIEGIKKQVPVCLVKCHHTSVYRIDPVEGNVFRRLENKVRTYFRKRNRLNEIDRYVACCDKFVFLSPDFVDQYLQERPSLKKTGKIEYIYNPLVYPDSFLPDELRLKQKEVLYVGRLHELYKRVSGILKSWERVEAAGDMSDWKLVIVGDGPDKSNYQELARDLGLKNVFFEGQQNPLSYYKRASVFVMTSVNEGWGMTLVEALQNGVVPIVMDSFLSLHHIVKDGFNGQVIPDRNFDRYTDGLIELMRNTELRMTMASNGLASCREFAVEKIVDRWEERIIQGAFRKDFIP